MAILHPDLNSFPEDNQKKFISQPETLAFLNKEMRNLA
jgi:hypothetical protein